MPQRENAAGSPQTKSPHRRLRELLAHACLAGLDPKLVILDEFQRFRWVLEQSLQEGTLSHRLLCTTPTLLLSATPYRMRSGGQDLEAQQDFVTLLRFLFSDGPEVELARTRFGELALALRLVRADTEEARASSVRRVRAAKLAVEDLLVRVMSRWERPVDDATAASRQQRWRWSPVTSRRTSRFSAASTSLPLGSLQHRETVEYWKSAPYLFNFMRGYRVKQVLAEATGGTAEAALRYVRGTTTAHIDWPAVERYQAIRMPNARGDSWPSWRWARTSGARCGYPRLCRRTSCRAVRGRARWRCDKDAGVLRMEGRAALTRRAHWLRGGEARGRRRT